MDPDTPGGSSDFQQDLLAIRHGPQVGRVALRWAGTPDLAEDILQAAYCGLAALKHPERIDNLHAYFLKALKNEASRLYAAGRVTPVENPEDALVPDRHGTAVCGSAPVRPLDELVGFSLQAQSWLKRIGDDRDCLLDAVPARSDDPARYRAVIYATAEQVLRDGINGEPSDADSNDAFRAAYSQFFAQPGAAANLLHQRFRRARIDVKALLKAIIDRDELT
jgi:DNA-directed RNA polymerase specialized sigma24 family protein